MRFNSTEEVSKFIKENRLKTGVSETSWIVSIGNGSSIFRMSRYQLVAPLNAIKWHSENLTEARISIDRARKVLRSVYSQATQAVHLSKNFAFSLRTSP
jgi:hypothetical protein